MEKSLSKISVDPIAVLLWCWLVFQNGFVVASNYVFVILIHEYAHFFVAKKLGYILKKFSISTYGFKLAYNEFGFDNNDEIKIAIAGPLANFVSAFFMMSVWWVFPSTFVYFEGFVVLSVLLGVFNLLPAFPLDGGRIFVCWCKKYFDEKLCLKLIRIVNFVFVGLFLGLFFVSMFVNFNPSFLIFAVFLFGGILEFETVSKFEKMNFFNKKKKQFARAEVCVIDENVLISDILKKMRTNKIFVFCLCFDNGKTFFLSEEIIKKISLNFDVDIPIKNIVLNK